MANYQNGSGNSFTGTSITAWNKWVDDEEERKRRQQEQAQQALANLTSGPTSAIASGVGSVSQKSNKYFSDTAKEAASKIDALGSSKTKSRLQEYFTVAKEIGGEERLGHRVQTISSMWNMYMNGYGGSSTVWDLAKSPFTISQLEAMMLAGNMAMHGRKDVPRSVVEAMGLDPEQEDHRKAAAAAVRIAASSTSAPPSTIDSILSRMRIEAQNKAATTLGEAAAPSLQMSEQAALTELMQSGLQKMGQNGLEPATPEDLAKTGIMGATMTGPGVLGKVLPLAKTSTSLVANTMATRLLGRTLLTGGMLYGGSQIIGALSENASLAETQNIESRWADSTSGAILEGEQSIYASNEVQWNYPTDELGNVTPMRTTPMQRLNLTMGYLNGISGTPDLEDLQSDAQQDKYDLDGNIIYQGKGKDLEVTGRMDNDWRKVFLEMFEEQEYYGIERRKALMMEGWVPSWAPIDDPEHPVWQRAEQRIEVATRAQEEAARRNPIYSAFRDMVGLPIGYGMENFFNKLFSQGILQGVYKSPIELAMKAGEVYNGGLAAFGVWTRLGKNDNYQNLWHQLAAQATQAGYSPVVTGSRQELARLADEGKLQNGADLMTIIRQTEAKEVDRRFSPAIALDMAELLGVDVDEVEQWGKDHPDFVHASQFAFDVAAATAVPLVKKATGKTKPLPRTVEAFRQDYTAGMKVVEAVENVKEGPLGVPLAADAAGGRHGSVWARTVERAWNGEEVAKHPVFSDLTDSILNDAREIGIVGAVEKNTPLRGAEAARVATDLRNAESAAKTAVIEKAAQGKYRYEKGTAGLPEDLTSRGMGARALSELDRAQSAKRIVPETNEVAVGEQGTVSSGKYAGMTGKVVSSTPKTHVLEVELDGAKKTVRVSKDRVAPEEVWEPYSPGYKEASEIAKGSTVEVLQGKRAGETYKVVRQNQKTVTLVDTATGETFRMPREKVFAPETEVSPIEVPYTHEYGAKGSAMRPVEAIEKSAVFTSVRSAIKKEQGANHNLIDITEFGIESAADMWSRGYNIFPYLEKSTVPKGSIIRRAIVLDLAKLEAVHPTLAHFLTHIVGKTSRTPLDMVEFSSQTSGKVIQDAARIASDSEKFALEIRYQWERAFTDKAKQGVANQIVKMAEKRFRESKQRKPIPEGETAGRKYSIVPDQKGEGGLIADGQSYADTSYSSYKAMWKGVRRSLDNAYKLDIEGMTAFERISHKYLDNPYRYITRKARPIGTMLRVSTVALGPQLFLKHGTVDPLKNVTAKTNILFRVRKVAREFDVAMEEISMNTWSETMSRMTKAEMSEQHYNIGHGGIEMQFNAGRIYDELGRPVNMAKGLDALRRIAQGDVFREYAKGGAEGVRAWLDTSEGRTFLYDSNNTARVREALAESGKKLSESELHKVAADDYVETYVLGHFQQLDMVAKDIMGGIKELVLANKKPTRAVLKRIVEDVNRDGLSENPWLSIGIDPKVSGVTGSAGWLVGKYMTPNRWSRKVLFKDTFVDVYQNLKKQGIESDKAATVAMDIAELEVTRVQFDLSHAWQIEQQNRWFAWFATKHRLYATFLGKLAVERPMIAGAALEVGKWIEDTNERKGNTDEYNRFNIDIPIGPVTWHLRLAPIFWLTDYPLESMFGKSMEFYGGKAANLIPGVNLNPSVGPFGWQLTGADNMVKTMALYVPLLTRYADGGGSLSEEEVTSWLEGVKSSPFGGQAAYEQACQSIGIARAILISRGVENPTVGDALGLAVASNIFYEVQSTVRTLPGKISISAEDKMWKKMEIYGSLLEEDKGKYLDDNPDVAAMMGIRDKDPYVAIRVDKGWDDFNWMMQERANDLLEAYKANPDFDAVPIMEHWSGMFEQLFDPKWRDNNGEESQFANPDFAAMWNANETDESFEEIMSSLYPLVDPNTLKRDLISGYVPTEGQANDYERELTSKFKKHMEKLGYNPGDSSSALYYQLKYQMITAPLNAFRKIDPTGYQMYDASNVARAMARGPNADQTASAYLLEAENKEKLKLLARGLNSAAKEGVSTAVPMFTKLTPVERDWIGWTGTAASRLKWITWAATRQAQDMYFETHGIKPTSKLGKQVRAQLDVMVEKWKKEDAQFAKEWDFANKPLHERLLSLGVGEGGGKRDQGWSDFLDIVSDYHEALATADNPSSREPGVGPASQTAANYSYKYLREVVKLMEENEDWFNSFRSSFTISAFGFSTSWKLEDRSDQPLWWSDNETETYEEEMVY